MNKLNKKLDEIKNNDELIKFMGTIIALIFGVIISWQLGLLDWILK